MRTALLTAVSTDVYPTQMDSFDAHLEGGKLPDGTVVGNGILTMAGRRYHDDAGRWLTSTYSDTMSQAYTYFESYQTKITVLATEYLRAQDATKNEGVVKLAVQDTQDNLEDQADLIPKPIPAGVSVDTKAGQMWSTRG